MKKTVSGDVGALLLNLLMPPHEHDAHRLQQAMAVSLPGGVFMPAFTHIFVCVCVQGLGTDEETLTEILCLRSRKQLDDISAAYRFCE